MSLTVLTDRSMIRAGASSTRYLSISFTAPDAPHRTDRAPVNLALVLDRSGSMAGANKFPVARQAAEQALRMLRADDRFALVVYDSEVNVLISSTVASPEAKQAALRALAEVQPRGSTDLCGGWLRGCEQIAARLDAEQLGRCLLLTDGLANHGVTSHAAIIGHARELRNRGISTSTLGVGVDFDERLLRDMAQEGGGHAYYVERAEQITDLLTSEVGETLETVMRDAAIQVALPPGARAEPLNTFRHSHIPGDNELRVELGHLVSGQEVTAIIAVHFPPGTSGERTSVRVTLSESTDGVSAPAVELYWSYAGHPENDGQRRDKDVDVAVAEIYAGRARSEATELNRAGHYDEARAAMERSAGRIEEYTQGDERLLRIARGLRIEAQMYESMMDCRDLKRAFFAAENMTKMRLPSGKARRRES
jgi:Ca-activated chloride channel homolog